MVSVISRWSVVPASVALLCSASALQAAPNETETVSYYNQIRPLFQAYCHGCHQPAKPRGKYVMTSFAEMLSGGESDTPAVVAGHQRNRPLESLL